MISRSVTRVLLLTATLSGLGACSTLPSSGPTASRVLQSAKAARDSNAFAVHDLDLDTAAKLSAAYAAQPPALKPLNMLNAPLPTDRVGPGDVLDVRVYEIGVALFGGTSSAEAGATEAPPTVHAENFAGLLVDSNGNIRLPYIGDLHVEGMTTTAIGKLIGQRLRSKSQSPQIIVKIVENLTNTAYLSGSVSKPGKYDLSPGGTRLLDVIAKAGGIEGSPEDLSVTLTRQDRTVEQPLSAVVPGTNDDIYLQPGDRIQINKRPRSFTVFGAAGRVSQIGFSSNTMSLAEAIAQAAGPNDATADPTAVFLFRDTPDPLDPTLAKRAIYRLNLLDPQGYFVAQTFRMRDKDLIYVASARSNQATKFIALVGQLFSPVITARAITK
jgi:polysaccharide export outer membrane protein